VGGHPFTVAVAIMSVSSHRVADIEAEVYFIPTKEGGRSGPAYSGYRPIHRVLPEYLSSGHHEYLTCESVAPGESALANIWFLTPEQYPHSMWVGRKIDIQEGNKVVGFATITKIFNTVLEKNG
jgi:elongation factor Tu